MKSYSKLFFLFWVILTIFVPLNVEAVCTGKIDRDLNISIPCADYQGTSLGFSLKFSEQQSDTGNIYYTLGDVSLGGSGETCAVVSKDLTITVFCAQYNGEGYRLVFSLYSNPSDPDGFYWKLVKASPKNNGENVKPRADSISLTVSPSIPYIRQQLSGRDPDGDILTYDLVSPSQGDSYSMAYINPVTGILYVTLKSSASNSFNISYRVTDGQLFSDPGDVSVTVNQSDQEKNDTGSNDIDPASYSEFQSTTYSSDLMGADRYGVDPERPSSISLSKNFPEPGDQGSQSSCVGWAAGYALKSYQEKVEIDWPLNTARHLFSPSFIYNQINYGMDQGAYIHEALDLIVNKGAATLDKMPYNESDYLRYPPSEAFEQALKYKALSWSKLNDTSQVKAALVNRKPVVIGIPIFQNFHNLSGPDAVYNTASGSSDGGHAVTITGYDDDKFGGAFRVINSWGLNWGNNGYFWLPYGFAQQIINQAYVLTDMENQEDPKPYEPSEPEPVPESLPNLTVQSWEGSYNEVPGGEGELKYSVVNNGRGTCPPGADINFILSENSEFTANDHYVVYEEIPFELAAGDTAYRDDKNPLSFKFPDEIPAGTYYMAMWVDDLNEIQESVENDNISPGQGTMNIQNAGLPDLTVKTWYAEWDGYGNGTLTYEIENSGAVPTTNRDWYVNLILDADTVAGNNNEIYLFYEQSSYILNPGQALYRNSANPEYFNLHTDHQGSPVPDGTYYMALWVDDTNSLKESNENNNGSYYWGGVDVYSWYNNSFWKNYAKNRDDVESGNEEDGTGNLYAYNGKKLPAKSTVYKVEITSDNKGVKTLNMIKAADRSGEEAGPEKEGRATGQKLKIKNNDNMFQKEKHSSTGVIMPRRNQYKMPFD